MHSPTLVLEYGYNSYTPVDGYVDLKDAIITKFKRDNNISYERPQLVVSTGAKQALYNVAQVVLNKGDEVILPCPYCHTKRHFPPHPRFEMGERKRDKSQAHRT